MAYVSANPMASRLILAISLFGTACSALAAPVATCPQQHREGKNTGLLENASVFDGPPQNLADLMPDLATSEWDLSMGQKHARARRFHVPGMQIQKYQIHRYPQNPL